MARKSNRVSTSPPLQRVRSEYVELRKTLSVRPQTRKVYSFRRKRLRGGVQFVLYAAVSLDARITAGEKEGSEWTSKEDRRFFHRELNAADVAIMGRKTFDAIKRPLTPRNRIVFSRSSPSTVPLNKGGARVGEGGGCLISFNGSAKKLLALLHAKNWTRVAVVGGTSIYDWFLKRNLVDEIYLTVEPLTFGAGKPLALDGLKKFSKFELVSVKRLNTSGTLLLHYCHYKSTN